MSPSLFGEKPHEAAVTTPEGAGGSKLLLRDERCDSSVDLREQRPADQAGGRDITTDPPRSAGFSTCSTGSDADLCTWVSVREDGAGPADSAGLFMSGARVGGNICPTREGSFPIALLDKGNEVANLDDSSLMGNRIERPLLSRGNTGSSFAKDLGVLVLAFQHLKPTAISWPGRRVVQLAFPHLKPIAATWSERGEGEHIRLGGRRTRRSSLVAARRVAGGSGA